MNTAQLSQTQAGEFQICGVMDFDTVPQLLKQSDVLFDQQQEITTINLRQVERSNSAGLALLIHWFRQANEQNLTIQFTNIPPQLREIAKISGIEGMFIHT